MRYPGRACLLGEHTDWAGGASLVVPLPLGLQVSVEPGRRGVRVRTVLGQELFDTTFPEEGRNHPADGPLRLVGAAIAFLAERSIAPGPAQVWIHGDLPPGRGFSSSAACALGVLDALSRLAGAPQDADTLAEWAYAVEHDRVGVPCGRLDPLASAAGAPAFLRWIEGRAQIRRVRPLRPVHLVAARFDGPRDTAGILAAWQRVARGEVQPTDGDGAVAAVREALATFGSEAEAGTHALGNGDLAGLGRAMDRCEEAYARAAARVPALAAPRLRKAVAAARAAGALGAKFSGAGGDGSLVALFADKDAAAAGAAGLAGLVDDAFLLRVDAP